MRQTHKWLICVSVCLWASPALMLSLFIFNAMCAHKHTHSLTVSIYRIQTVCKNKMPYISSATSRVLTYIFFSTNNCLLYHNNAKYYLIRRLFQWLAWQNEHIIPLPCVHFILCIRFCVFICEKSVLHTCININYGMVNK